MPVVPADSAGILKSNSIIEYRFYNALMGGVLTRFRAFALLSFCFLYCSAAWAQPSLGGGAGVQQKQRPLQEEFPVEDDLEPRQASPLVLPPLEPRQESDRLSPQLRVYVQAFRLEGNQVFSDAELGEIAAPFEGRVITAAELQQLRNAISVFYLNQGYINSGAVIPDQKIEGDIITLQIIEGELTRVEIAGNKRLRDGYIESRLLRGAGEPLNIAGLENTLKILQQNPLIERLNAELRPGDRRGESALMVQVEEGRPGHVDIALNNHRPPSVGAEQLEVDATLYSLTGNGDPFTAYLGHTEGLDDVFLSYQLPVNSRDTRLGVYFEYTESEVIEDPFDDLDIESDAKTWGFSVTHPLRKTLNGHLIGDVSLEKRSSNTTLLGVPFSFVEGADNGRTDVAPLRLSIDWLKRDMNSVFAARSIVTVGLDALGATKNSDGPDGQFIAWAGQLQWVRRLGKSYQAILRASAQRSNQALLPMEKFVVGGHDTVRGYRENQLVRDNGYIASAELRMPLFQGDATQARWQIAPFIDHGKAWEEERDTLSPRDITSAGVVLRWQPTRRLQASVTAAHAFENIDRVDQDRDLQDRGINLLLRYRLY